MIGFDDSLAVSRAMTYRWYGERHPSGFFRAVVYAPRRCYGTWEKDVRESLQMALFRLGMKGT